MTGISVSINGDIEGPEFDRYFYRPPGLREHLDFQLHVSYASARETEIGTYIIDSLDPAGYLVLQHWTRSPAEIGAGLAEVEEVLALIQTFHPHGVGARSMEECLMIQLQHGGHSYAGGGKNRGGPSGRCGQRQSQAHCPLC